MTTRIFSNPRQPLMLKDGVTPNALGKIFFYEPGAGSTVLKYAYSKPEFIEGNRLQNPVTVDLAGIPPAIFFDGDYRVVITDSSGVPTEWGIKLDDIPNYQAPELDAQFQDWAPEITYNIPDFAQASDGKYYQSIANNNKGNDPTISRTQWSEKFFTSVYNVNETYGLDVPALYEGDTYKSLQTVNKGNQPDISSGYWENISAIADYVAGRNYGLDVKVNYGASIYVSIQTPNTGNTPDASPSYWRNLFEPTIVTDFTAAGFEYRKSDGYNTPTLAVSAVVADSTFESIGPTGSGADNIWAAMDVIPSEAKFAIVSFHWAHSRSGTTDDNLRLFLYARQTGAFAGIGFCQIAQDAGYGGTASNDANIFGRVEATIPLDSSLRFDVQYILQNETGGSGLNAQLVGYKL